MRLTASIGSIMHPRSASLEDPNMSDADIDIDHGPGTCGRCNDLYSHRAANAPGRRLP